MKIYNEPIPERKIGQFHSVLCATGGRYLSNPIKVGDVYRVSYKPGDPLKQSRLWRNYTENMKEKMGNQWYRRLLRRLTTL